MSPFLIFVLALLAILAIALLIQGVITLLATWVVTGDRPALGAVIRAILLAGLTYAVAIITVLFQLRWLESLDVPLIALVAVIVLLPLLASAWIFARCLKLTLLQAVAIVLLVNAVNIGIGLLSQDWLPEAPYELPREVRQFA